MRTLLPTTKGAILRRRIMDALTGIAVAVDRVYEDSIKVGGLGRSNFDGNTFYEMRVAQSQEGNVHSSRAVNGAPLVDLRLKTTDPYGIVDVAWSANVRFGGDVSWVAGWPVVNGQAIWGALDIRANGPVVNNDDEVVTTFGIEDALTSISGSASYPVGHAGCHIGLVFASVGPVDFYDAIVTARSLHR
jgi:hypothetical protein